VPPRAGQAKATSPAAPDPIAFSPPSHHAPPWCCDDHLNPPSTLRSATRNACSRPVLNPP
jgi:hypothetical protein